MWLLCDIMQMNFQWRSCWWCWGRSHWRHRARTSAGTGCYLRLLCDIMQINFQWRSHSGRTIEDIQQEPVQVEEAICTWLLCDVMAVLTSQHQISEIYPNPLANLLEHKASANEAFLGYRFSDSSAHSNAVHFKPISCGIPLMLALCWLTSMNKRF